MEVPEPHPLLRPHPSTPYQISDEVSCKLSVLCGDEGEGSPLLSRPPRAANTMDVRINVLRDVKIHHCLDGRDVQPSR